MKKIIRNLADYLRNLNKAVFLLSVVLLALLVFVNYRFQLNEKVNKWTDLQQGVFWYFIFLLAFSFPYVLQFFFGRVSYFQSRRFVALLLVAPAIFAWKMSYSFRLAVVPDPIVNAYWNGVVYWPLKLVVVCFFLFLVWRFLQKEETGYGLAGGILSLQPYVVMLLLMVPLVAAASTQPDFLSVYPKFQQLALLRKEGYGEHRFLFELSYGSDFFTIELFFRGFLVLAFAQWAGTAAILPMALFYCTIHFGKPLGECISSFFGGLILGVVVYHTRTIYGGLLVHLGIAWLMELGGYLASAY